VTTPCEQHAKIDKLESALSDISIKLAVIDERLKAKVVSFDKHVDEGEKQGGWRDRLVIIENEVKGLWKMSVGAGIIGGLIGAGAPNAVKFISHLLGA
jgi:outer membrane murein-binding lipoprotein Lpp